MGRPLILIFLLLSLVACVCGAQSEVAPPASLPNVLVISSYNTGYQWSDDQLKGVLKSLDAAYPSIEPVVHYLDARRFPSPAREKLHLDDLLIKVSAVKPAIIVTLDNAAFDFALAHRAELDPAIPLVFGGLNHYSPELLRGDKLITGVAEETRYEGTFRLARALCPKASRVLVVSSQTASGRESRRGFEKIAETLYKDYSFDYFEDWTNAQLLRRVSTLDPSWFVVILDSTQDSSGHFNYNDADFSQRLSSETAVPVFINAFPPGDHDWSVELWHGLGGGMIVAELHGRRVGEMVVKILAGTPVSSLPVEEVSPELLAVDHRHLARFGFRVADLPPGTVVYNEPSNFYSIHRTRIIVGLVVMGLLASAVVLLSIVIILHRRAARLEERLRTSQKLEAVGLLAGGIAHDFNNIIQLIQGHVTLLIEELGDTAHAEDLGVVRDAAQRAARLTRQLLLFSRRQELHREAVDANALVGDMLRLISRLIGEHIQVSFRPAPLPLWASLDRGQLEQVILNLCVNARDAMPHGGTLELTACRRILDDDDCRSHQGLNPGPHLQLSVRDTGSGMSQDVVARVFEPFFTTKPQGQGTGLGLAVVYGIVKSHMGHISVYSELGKGTVFNLFIPLLDAVQKPETVANADASVPRGHGLVLVAEDEMPVQSLAKRILTKNGFQVITANDGVEALELVRRHRGELRLLLLDVMMPRLSGKQVHDTLRKEGVGLPVIFSSGYSAETLPGAMAPEPGVALLGKPYAGVDLLRAVHRILGEDKQPSD